MVAQIASSCPNELGTPRAATAFAWADLDIEIRTTSAPLQSEWRALEAHGTASIFQSWNLVHAWIDHAALAQGEVPLFVAGRAHGRLCMILPLAIVRRGGVRVLQWLTQSHANYGMGLLDPELIVRLQPGDTDALLLRIAREVGAHVVHLDRQPAQWAGLANPFAASPCARQTANDTFMVGLDRDYAAQYKSLFNKRALQPLKRRRRRLEEMGAVTFSMPQDGEAKRKAFGWFVAHKREQLSETGGKNPFDEPGIIAFYEALLETDGIAFEIDQLLVGTQRAALGMTLFGNDVAYGVNTAHASQFSRGSPGTLLQHHIIAKVHAHGARAYDLGPGYLPYKMEWAPRVIALVATTHAVQIAGVPMQMRIVLETLAKARIKRTPGLANLGRFLSRLASMLKTALRHAPGTSA